MRTSFHHQPEAQHPIFQLSTSWQADYPIFWRYSGHGSRAALIASGANDPKQTSLRRREYGMIRAYALRGRPI